MELLQPTNYDLSQRVVIDTSQMDWVQSTTNKGLFRKLLERHQGEIARSTSIIKYEPNTQISFHTHFAGQQFYVLNGTFSDEYGDYPQGYYSRNPWKSQHKPHFNKGCSVFLKLRYFDQFDTSQFKKNTIILPKKDVTVLHQYQQLKVEIIAIESNKILEEQTHTKGEEIFVLQGQFFDQHGHYQQGTWIRNPPQFRSKKFTKDSGVKLLRWTGHL